MKDPIINTVEARTWTQFRSTGLLLILNSILHIAGWALVVEVDKETNEVTKCYPARVKFRGFSQEDTQEEHVKLAQYLADNAPNFPEEIK